MKPLIVALDVETSQEALNLTQRLSPHVNLFKVGPVLFLKYGGELIRELRGAGAEIFLDLKFHDIPSVVQRSVERSAEWGVYSATIHISGGTAMMKAAASVRKRPKLWGVTVLTSLDQPDLNVLGIKRLLDDQVQELAKMASESGLDGVIASVREAKSIKTVCGRPFQVVTPGIRLDKEADDQKRIQTPADAMRAGVDFFVMGRPIIEAPDPVEAVQRIYHSLSIPV